MSTELQQQVDALTKRIDEIEGSSIYTPDFEDVVVKRVDEYYKRLESEISDIQRRVANKLGEIHAKSVAKVEQEIRKVTSEEIAENLSKQILVTRQANRKELKDATVVRHATPAELRNH